MTGRVAAVVVAAMFVLDQWTKKLVVDRFELGESLPVIPGFFSLTHVRNRGGAFGLFSDLPDGVREGFFIVFAIATVAALAWMFRSAAPDDRAQRVALVSVIGGAAGNLYDRVLHGEVVDFLDVFVGDWHWPAFNVADSFITCGVILLILTTLREETRATAAD